MRRGDVFAHTVLSRLCSPYPGFEARQQQRHWSERRYRVQRLYIRHVLDHRDDDKGKWKG